MKKTEKYSSIQPPSNSKQKYFYAALIMFILLVNMLVYLQLTQAFAPEISTTKNEFPLNIEFHNGDLILRNGKGLLSSVFRKSSLNQPLYTHAGFLYKFNNTWYVYHYIDDEKQSGLHIERLSDFIDYKICSSYAFYRYHLNSNVKHHLDSLIISSQYLSLPFDSEFNFESDSALYCTEYIAKILINATGQQDFIPTTTVGLFNYIAPDNLYLNANCNLIYKNEY